MARQRQASRPRQGPSLASIAVAAGLSGLAGFLLASATQPRAKPRPDLVSPVKTTARALADGDNIRDRRWVGLSEPSLGQTSLSAGMAQGSTATLRPAPNGASDGQHRPSIAIIIDDLGYSSAITERADALPAAITFSFLAVSNDVAAQVMGARKAGHEVLLHLAMEPVGTANAGPLELKVGQSQAQMASILDSALARVPGAIGLNNHMGSKFTADPTAVATLGHVLETHHLIFVDSRTTTKTVAARVMREDGLPVAERRIFLDDEPETKESVRSALAQAEKLARAQGSIVAIGHPREATLAVLADWSAKVESDGIDLVSVSEHIRRVNGSSKLIAGKAAQTRHY